MTIEEMEERLRLTTLKSGGMLFEPLNGDHWFEIDAAEPKAALAEIKVKLPLVQSGWDKFTACEILMFRLLAAHCEVARSVPQREDDTCLTSSTS
jgi:hypothetical protein